MSPRLARGLRRALAALAIAAPLAAGLAPGVAPAEPRAKPSAPSVGTPAEEEALALYQDDKLLGARTRAQAILDENPRSIVGHYVLGSVLRDAEGSLPRSLSHLREAKRLFSLLPEAERKDLRGTRLGTQILFSLASTAEDMEDFELALRTLDEYDTAAPRKLAGYHVWPLMKLRRYGEARAFAEEALASGNPNEEMRALNGLATIAGELHHRREGYDLAKRAYEKARSRARSGFAVYAHNASLHALAMLRFDEAESLALSGAREIARSNSNPWRLLAVLYVGEGRADDTVAALREMQRWVAAQPPKNRDQKSAETDASVAVVLLAAGEPAAGLRFVGRALDRPDRRAITSSSPAQSLGGHAMIRRALLQLDAEIGAERAAARGVGAEALGVASSLSKRAEAWPDEQRAIAVLADEETLEATLCPYSAGSLEPFPSFLTGDLVSLLGPGVVSAALARARAADADFPESEPYYAALDAEIALARGDDARALAAATSAVDALPKAEALLRARIAAIGAEAAARAHRMDESLRLFERALALDPGATRRLGLAIPARFEVAGGADAALAAAALRRSPRFSSAASGFVVRVEGDAGHLVACLLTPSQAKLACGEASAAPGDRPGDLAVRLSDEFHRAAFAMRFSLTLTDLRSLDGSTTAAEGTAREALRGLLGDEGNAPQP